MSRLLVRATMLAVAALAFAVLFVPVTQSPDPAVSPSALSDYFAARGQNYCWGDCPANAQRVCISGDCPCFDEPYQTQCFAERKSGFRRDNPPRGELTGVCWAAQGRWERDAAGKQDFQTRGAVYSKVRFNETQTLSKWARDDRDAGFEIEVGEAWKEFVQSTYATEFPAADGWSWTTRCVSTDHPRKAEDQEWTRAQGQASYQRVFLPRFGVADTPEERALEAKLAKERAAKAAEDKRIAEAKAAEAARIKAAAEAKRRAEVAAMEAQLGAGKRASAERLLAMNEQVAEFRPKVPLAVTPKPTPSPSPAAKTIYYSCMGSTKKRMPNGGDGIDTSYYGIITSKREDPQAARDLFRRQFGTSGWVDMENTGTGCGRYESQSEAMAHQSFLIKRDSRGGWKQVTGISLSM